MGEWETGSGRVRKTKGQGKRGAGLGQAGAGQGRGQTGQVPGRGGGRPGNGLGRNGKNGPNGLVSARHSTNGHRAVPGPSSQHVSQHDTARIVRVLKHVVPGRATRLASSGSEYSPKTFESTSIDQHRSSIRWQSIET